MRERPILFSGPMVSAILDGRKTVTRRAVRPQPQMLSSGRLWWETPKGRMVYSASREWHEYLHDLDKPYAPGDRLWVRETWAPSWHHAQPSAFYRADADAEEIARHPDFDGWQPSIHMPRWASRLTLEVTSVRVERLQDISKADVIAEGITERDGYPIADVVAGWHEPFAELWDHLNAKRGRPWESNPWVWVVEFRRVES